jgi:Protein of unknown function (DUF3298)
VELLPSRAALEGEQRVAQIAIEPIRYGAREFMKPLLGLLLVITCATTALAQGGLSSTGSEVARTQFRHTSYFVGTSHADSRVDRFTIGFDLPIIKGAPELRGAVARAMKRLRESRVASLREYCDKIATPVAADARPERCEGEEKLEFHIVFADEHLLSIEVPWFNDTRGAAHPSHGTYTFTWTVCKPHLLTLGELFRYRHDYLPRISELARAKLSVDHELSEFTNKDWIYRGTKPIEENFRAWTVSDRGLRVVFGEYQVAAYVAGPQAIQCSWDELKGLVDPHGPVGYLFK